MPTPRLSAHIPIRFRAESVSGDGNVRNASEGGLFVGTQEIPQQGETVEVELRAPGWPPIDLLGLVWWTTNELEQPRPRAGFGLRLLDDSEAYRELLASLT